MSCTQTVTTAWVKAIKMAALSSTTSSSVSTRSGPPCNTPAIVTYTTFGKEALSYRWVIADIKALLLNSAKFDLRSPVFRIVLPPKPRNGEYTSWYLQLTDTNQDTNQDSAQPQLLSLFLCQDGRNNRGSSTTKQFWILDCCFSVLNHCTGEPLVTASVPRRDHEVGVSMKDYGVRDFLKKDHIEKLIHDNFLTIQVDAIYYFYADPITKTITSPTSNATPSSSDNVLAGMKSMFKNQLFSDVTIQCGAKHFTAHKAVLASQSAVFDKMLEADMQEKITNVIEIPDFHPDVISSMLAYLYTGTPLNMEVLVKDLLAIANKYELTQLLKMCEKKLVSSIRLDNVVEMLILADMHGASDLKKACLAFIHSNSTGVFATNEWQDFKKNFTYAALFTDIVEYKPC